MGAPFLHVLSALTPALRMCTSDMLQELVSSSSRVTACKYRACTVTVPSDQAVAGTEAQQGLSPGT